MGQAVLESTANAAIPNNMFRQAVIDNLVDLADRRVNDMHRGGTKMQVISHIPTVESLETCCKVNDQLFEAVQKNPNRFRGFAFLPLGTPEYVADELERCVKSLHFVGALIPSHAHGKYYDDQAYWPMFEKAQQLDVPVYIHPTPADDFDRYAGNYDKVMQTLIAGPALCWHNDVGMHMLRLYASGVFDAYPKVKIILGHNGEMLPFMLDRIDKFFSRKWGRNKRNWMTVWNENVWITTSGMFHLEPLRLCLSMCKPDRVLYSKTPLLRTSDRDLGV